MTDSENGVNLKVSLRPRRDFSETTQELKTNAKVTGLELNIHKNWLKEAPEKDLDKLLDAICAAPALRNLVLSSKNSGTQDFPLQGLAQCVGEAQGLQEIHLNHIKLKGNSLDYEDLASAIGDHPNLRVLVLGVENLDALIQTIEAAGHLPTLEQLTVESASEASNNLQLVMTIQSLCASTSLKQLTLTNVALSFERFIPLLELLSTNEVLEELVIAATECTADGGRALAALLGVNRHLQRFVLHVDKLHIKGAPEDQLVAAISTNPCLEYLELKMDGRMSDMMVVRKLQTHFRDALKSIYKVGMQSGVEMKVTCQRLEATAAAAE